MRTAGWLEAAEVTEKPSKSTLLAPSMLIAGAVGSAESIMIEPGTEVRMLNW